MVTIGASELVGMSVRSRGHAVASGKARLLGVRAARRVICDKRLPRLPHAFSPVLHATPCLFSSHLFASLLHSLHACFCYDALSSHAQLRRDMPDAGKFISCVHATVLEFDPHTGVCLPPPPPPPSSSPLFECVSLCSSGCPSR